MLHHLFGIFSPVFLSMTVASFMCGFAIFIRWSHSSSLRKLPYLRKFPEVKPLFMYLLT